MNLKGLKGWLVLGCSLVAVIVLVGLLFTSQLSADSKSQTVVKDGGEWQYHIEAEANNTANLSISYDTGSVTALKSHVIANKALAVKLEANNLKQVEALITFNHPLSLDEFTRLVEDRKLSVKSYIIRMATPSGERSVLGGVPEGNVMLPQAKFESQKAFIQQHSPGAEFKGFIDATVTFNISDFNVLQSSKGVFLVDVTATVAKQELKQSMSKLSSDNIAVDMPHPYPYLEDLGLENFQ